MWNYILLAILGYIGYRFFFSAPPPRLRGVYSQPGPLFRLKVFAFRLLMKLRNRQKAAGSGKAAGYGLKSRDSIEEMDKLQELPGEHPKAVDAVYFNGGTKDGYYLVTATARRHKGLVQTILFIRVPDVGLLQLSNQPDTSLYSDLPTKYAAGGLEMSVMDAMHKWKLTFDGEMTLKVKDKEDEALHVKFDLEWTAYTPYFDFDTDLNPQAMAESIAREPWSRPFFNKLKEAHQTHYEQFGEITGTVHLGKYGERQLKVQGVRDHSYGNVRDWSELHRYGIQYAHVEDGTSVCIGTICMRPTMTRLVIGYIIDPDGKMESVSWSDFYLHKSGEDGQDPDDLEINFVAGNKPYKLLVHVVARPVFYMGEEWEARIVERMCTYSLNGKPGWGISEWNYRNLAGKANKIR